MSAKSFPKRFPKEKTGKANNHHQKPGKTKKTGCKN